MGDPFVGVSWEALSLGDELEVWDDVRDEGRERLGCSDTRDADGEVLARAREIVWPRLLLSLSLSLSLSDFHLEH